MAAQCGCQRRLARISTRAIDVSWACDGFYGDTLCASYRTSHSWVYLRLSKELLYVLAYSTEALLYESRIVKSPGSRYVRRDLDHW